MVLRQLYQQCHHICQHPLVAPQLCTAVPTLIFVALKCSHLASALLVRMISCAGVSSRWWNKKQKIYCWCKILTFSTECLGKVCGKNGKLCQPQPLRVSQGGRGMCYTYQTSVRWDYGETLPLFLAVLQAKSLLRMKLEQQIQSIHRLQTAWRTCM